MLLYNLLFSKHAGLVLFTHDFVGQKSDRAQWAQLVSDLYDVDIWKKQFHEYHATDEWLEKWNPSILVELACS